MEPNVSIVALVGNPNTGKTTLFNSLTGLSQKVGNYPGVTVERRTGQMQTEDGGVVEIHDLPGIYSLVAHSPDEKITRDLLLGKQRSESSVDLVVSIVDASNLERNLYLVSQVMEIGLPLVLALNMIDVAKSRNIWINSEALSKKLGIPVAPICAYRNQGIDYLCQAITEGLIKKTRVDGDLLPRFPDALTHQVNSLCKDVNRSRKSKTHQVQKVEVFRAIMDEGVESRLTHGWGEGIDKKLFETRKMLGESSTALEAEVRFGWIERTVSGCISRPKGLQTIPSDRIDRMLTHRFFGMTIFLFVMGLVFQSIYSWSGPLMQVIDEAFGTLGEHVRTTIPDGAIQSLLVDGVIGGVGSVLIFLPQIAILFTAIALLEDCGYMSRAAFLMDRMLTLVGLSGKSFVPLLSSFACAVPGIMSARTIEDPRSRIVTILVAPLMSCSARLPVYVIFIAVFIPDLRLLGGLVGLQGLTLFGMYCVGILVAIPVAWILKSTILKGQSTPFVLEFPSYKWPGPKAVGLRVYQNSKAFVTRAGTIILAAAIVMWALAYFPRSSMVLKIYQAKRENALKIYNYQTQQEALDEIDSQMASEFLNQSFLGRAGRFIEPVVRPLGWDWRMGMAALASFPAREIVVATLGTIYSLGSNVDETSESLRNALKSAKGDDGRPIFNISVALSVMVFFALCAQCMSTLAIVQRETQSWRWAAFSFGYMTILAYVGAFITFQTAVAIGYGG